VRSRAERRGCGRSASAVEGPAGSTPTFWREGREPRPFVVGESDPATDWPAFQPGPLDGRFGYRQHAVCVRFDHRGRPSGRYERCLDVYASQGPCPQLRFSLNDAQGWLYPRVDRRDRSGVTFPPSPISGGAAMHGPIDVSLQREGLNTLAITTVQTPAADPSELRERGPMFPGMCGSQLSWGAIGLRRSAPNDRSDADVDLRLLPLYRRRRGTLVALAHLTIALQRPFASGTASVELEGHDRVAQRELRGAGFGHLRLELELPALREPTEAEVRVRLDGEKISRRVRPEWHRAMAHRDPTGQPPRVLHLTDVPSLTQLCPTTGCARSCSRRPATSTWRTARAPRACATLRNRYSAAVPPGSSSRTTQRVTMLDLAREAGVSKGTVSRVLNGREGVGDETRQRVLDLIASKGYEADYLAQNLARGRSMTIGVIFPGSASGVFANPVYTEMLGGIGDRATAAGYSLSIVSVPSIEAHEHVTRDIARGRLDGVVLPAVRDGDSLVDLLSQTQTPMVLVGHRDDSPNVVWVDCDGDRAQYETTSKLIAAGHRRLAFLDGPMEYMACRLRQQGFESAMREAGLKPVASTSGPFSSDYGHRETTRLLRLRKTGRPTAIMAGSDLIAAGALAAVREAGLRVPEDVAVTGFDDDRLAPMMNPPLTTVRMPIRDMGTLAADLLIELINGRKPEPPGHILATTVVVRASSGDLTPADGGAAVDG
jgi:DNA-binding LacI/PurR family transcriptional regulator